MMDEVPEKKKFWIYLFIYFCPSLYTPIPYSTMMTTIRQDEVIDKDKMAENDKRIDNEMMKMKGG